VSLVKWLKTSMIELIGDCFILWEDFLISLAETPYKKFTKRLKAGELGGQTSISQQKGRLSLHQL
jgi:hypothetical protein